MDDSLSNVKVLIPLIIIIAVLAGPVPRAVGEGGVVVLALSSNDISISVKGRSDDDWCIQASTNLADWTTLTELGTLLSGGVGSALHRTLGAPPDRKQFYRTLKTDGLYDPSVFRTINLTFSREDWNEELATARTLGSNVSCSAVALDNGATATNVGARYKGNTSYMLGGRKKSINLEVDWLDPSAELMDYKTINLNNAAGDETIMREPLFFTIMSKYTPCPKGAMVNVVINGSQWGVYSLVQQEDAQLVREWFPSSDGDRWRTPNAATGTGGFASSNSAFAYLGVGSISTYMPNYELKSTKTNEVTAWLRLIYAIYVLNKTPADRLREKVEDVFAVDDWLWFLALENIFVDDDSYWNKGADYSFYFEVESGRIHPLEHDGNETFTSTRSVDYTLSPVAGADGKNRPLLYRLLSNNELRQRYLAHMRTVLKENFNPTVAVAMIDRFHAMSLDAILTDSNRNFSMSAYTNDLEALKSYVANRHTFLLSHPELTPVPPRIDSVAGPKNAVYAMDSPWGTARVTSDGDSGVGSVWLYFRDKPYGRFTASRMSDDGAHGDGAANDSLFGASLGSHPAATRVQYYVEARATNAVQAACFSPARAEWQTYDYQVCLSTAAVTPLVINEFMADNVVSYADPQGEYDDWIELRNLSNMSLNLSGGYLSDDPDNPRKWQFPENTMIAAYGYLIVWADNDTADAPGLHANFKLSTDGERILLIDVDGRYNRVLDSVEFGRQNSDVSYGRSAANSDVWMMMNPTPDAPN